MNYKSIVIILAFLLTSIFSYAQEEDFVALTNLNLNIFQCSSQDFDIKIINTGNTVSNFLIQQTGKAAKWNYLSQNIFILLPGEEKIIKNSLNVPCNSYGTYYLTTIISTDNQDKYIKQVINVLKPQNIDFKNGVFEQTIEACKTAKFTLELFNPANFSETYSLKINDKIKETKLSDEKVMLNGLESKNISIEVNPTDCELNGELFLPLEVRTENTKLIGDLDLKLIILPAKITKVDGPDKISIDYVESKHQVNITNQLNKTEKYTLSIDGANWFKLDNTTLTLNKDETKTFNIISNPPATVTQGSYNLKLIIKDQSGKETIKNFVFNLKKPIPRTTLYKYIGFGVGGILLIIIIVILLYQAFSKSAREKRKRLRLSKEKIKKELEKELKLEYKLVPRSELRAKRTKKFFKVIGVLFLLALFITTAILSFYFRDHRLLVKYNSWIYLLSISVVLVLIILIVGCFTIFRSEEKKQELAKQKEKQEKERQRNEQWKEQERTKLEAWKLEEQKRLRLEIDQGYKENYKLINKKDIAELKKVKTNLSWFYWTILLFILVGAGVLSWYFKDFLISYKVYSINSAIILVIVVVIHLVISSRRKVQKWKLVSERTKQTMSVASKGLLQFLFSLNNSVEGLKLRVLKSKKNVHVIPGKNIYQYFNVEANVEEDLFDKTNYSFKVSKSWLQNKSVSKDDVKLVRFVDDKWINISNEVVSEDNKFVYYLANTNYIGQFAIIGKEKSVVKTKESRSWVGYLSLGLLLVIIISLITFVATKTEDPTHLKGVPDQSWEKDTTRQLNLSPYFKDPDNDKLVFSLVEKPDHIQVDIYDNVVVLTPELNWNGQEYIRFKTTDKEGKSTESNRVRLEVNKSLIPKLVRKYALQILGVLLIAALLLIVIVFRRSILRFLEED